MRGTCNRCITLLQNCGECRYFSRSTTAMIAANTRVGCILFFLLLSGVVATAQLRIAHGDFESAMALKSWECKDPGYRFSREQASRNGGKYVASLRQTGPEGIHSAFAQELNLPRAARRQHYRFSGSIRTKGVTQGVARLFLQVFDSAGRKLSFVNTDASIVAGTTGWKDVSFEVWIPAGARLVRLGGLLIGPGHAWFDALVLKPLPVPRLTMPAAVRQYLDTALNLMLTRSIQAADADTAALRLVAYNIAEGAQTTAGTYEAIRCTLYNMGGDRHGRFQTPEEARAYEGTEAEPGPLPTGQRIGAVGYVTVPMFLSVNKKRQEDYVHTLRGLFCSMDTGGLQGWVVDLRNNTGGNCAPMLLGVAPLLGDGVITRAVDYAGRWDSTELRNGLFARPDSSDPDIAPGCVLRGGALPVGVLTNGNCGSSGEVVVLAFRGRPRTQSFGSPTAGYTSSNEGFRLSDGAVLLVTVGRGGDRNRNLFDAGIPPDVAIEEQAGTDAVLAAAIRWLEGR
ncbi:MAG: hypothetical protein EOP50_02955 [Sphingobacteriales bacterium]|nr:MAG: hypothetical protein EOP50_02955 [Sphingobacteriales bacterium]